MHIKGEGKRRWEAYIRKMAKKGIHRFINLLEMLEAEKDKK